MIQFQKVSKAFGQGEKQVNALSNVDFSVKEGEIFGIIGSSGAGKSTLLRCVNLLEKPTQGTVLVGGENVGKLTSKELQKARQKIGMIFQHFYLMPSRTIGENVAFPLKKSGLPKAEIQKKVKELLELVHIGEKEHFYPNQLSGGQKQRVAIARALANDPKVLLCDEATSALDPQTTQAILELLQEINKRLGLTILLITHEMDVIKEICHRVAVMEFGEVKEIGPVFDVLSDPQAEITKKLIKSTSTLEKIHDLIGKNSDFVAVEGEQVLVKLTYTMRNTAEPLLSKLTERFHVEVNIIFADVSMVQDAPIGGTVVILSGEKEPLTQAFAYLLEKNVRVEVLKDGRIST